MALQRTPGECHFIVPSGVYSSPCFVLDWEHHVSETLYRREGALCWIRQNRTIRVTSTLGKYYGWS